MMDEPKELFKNASEYEPSEASVLANNFKNFFLWLLDTAKSNAPQNNGISIKAQIGEYSAEITYAPPIIRYSRGRSQVEKKKATKADMEAIVMEIPDMLELVETDTEYYIKTKAFMGDQWRGIMTKVDAFNGNWKAPEGQDKKCWVIPK